MREFVRFLSGRKKKKEEIEKLRLEIQRLRQELDNSGRKNRVAIFADWENVQRALEKDGDIKFERLGQFIRRVAGDKNHHIISFTIFVPDHMGQETMRWISHNYSVLELVAPVNVRHCPSFHIKKDGQLKDVDSVDWKVKSAVEWYIKNVRDLDEIMVLTLDFDYSDARSLAEMAGIKYTPVFLSKRFAQDYKNAYGGLADAIMMFNGNGSEEKGG